MNEQHELLKVSAIGSGGALASLTIVQISAVVSLFVGLATLAYVCAKTYFLIKNKGGESRD